MYAYIQSEPGLWTVGFYDPQGCWHADSDHTDREAAADRVHYLNGGNGEEDANRRAEDEVAFRERNRL